MIFLYLILKRFLFKPVRRMLSERKAALDKQYADAADAHYLTNPQAYVIEKQVVDADSTLHLRMAAGGGFGISFERCK